MLLVQTLLSLVHDDVSSYEVQAEALEKHGTPEADHTSGDEADGQ